MGDQGRSATERAGLVLGDSWREAARRQKEYGKEKNVAELKKGAA